jgi:hypothetical protein
MVRSGAACLLENALARGEQIPTDINLVRETISRSTPYLYFVKLFLAA